MFKHLPVAHFHDATFLTKHIEVYRRAVVTGQIRVFLRVMTGFGVTVNFGMGAGYVFSGVFRPICLR